MVVRYYIRGMETISVHDAQNRLAELAREVQEGESITVFRNDQALFGVNSEPKRGGLNLEAGQTYLRSKGITNPVPYIADDFDDPLPEDFLIRPLP